MRHSTLAISLGQRYATMRAMTDRPGHRLGQGPLTMTKVLADARGMFALGRTRVILVALLLFGFPALLIAVVETLGEGMTEASGAVPILVLLAVLLVAAVLQLFGPVIFAGYLDEAIGREYLFGHHVTFRQVLRSLPWLRLLIASAIVALATGIGLTLLVVPGVLFYMLFALVGPVIVQERRTLVDGFRRTFALSRHSLLIIALLVLIPTLLEIVVHEAVGELAHGAWIGIEIAAEWLVAALLGGAVGVIEVALAAELMARNPSPSGRAGRLTDDELLDDGQAPAVGRDA
jgi:hypothetical protein